MENVTPETKEKHEERLYRSDTLLSNTHHNYGYFVFEIFDHYYMYFSHVSQQVYVHVQIEDYCILTIVGHYSFQKKNIWRV